MHKPLAKVRPDTEDIGTEEQTTEQVPGHTSVKLCRRAGLPTLTSVNKEEKKKQMTDSVL